MKIISKWIRNSKVLGRGAVALDVLTSVPVVVGAFTSEKGNPIKTTAEEAGRLYGGYLGGGVGAEAGVAIATLVLGSVGGIPLAIGIAVCAAAGAYAGATLGSNGAKFFVSNLYQFVDDLVNDDGGFFDWNVEQL
jgi:hypothetical protein